MANASKSHRPNRSKTSKTPPSKTSKTPLRTQTWVTTCALLAIAPMVVAHVVGAATINPLISPVSDYAWMPGGYLMVWFSTSLLAACGAILAHRVHRAASLWPELRRRLRWVVGLLISFTVGLFIAGVLPTSLPEAMSQTVSPSVSSMVSAVVHRIGAGWALIALPAAGLLLARSAAVVVLPGYPGRLVTIARWLLYGVLIALVVHFTLFLIFGSGLPAFGLFERIGFAVMIQHLILLGFAFGNQTAADVNAAMAAAGEQAMAAEGGLVEIAGAMPRGEHRAELTEHRGERFDPVGDQIGDPARVLDHASDDQTVTKPGGPPITGPQAR